MAARASSRVRRAERPDSTASRRSSESSAMKSSSLGPPGGRSRLAHQMLSTTPARSTTTSTAYRRAATGIWKAAPCTDPSGGTVTLGVAVAGCRMTGLADFAVNRCRPRPKNMATATAIIPAASTKMSTPRSLTATALTAVAPALCASTPANGARS